MIGNIDIIDEYAIHGWFLDNIKIEDIISTDIIINNNIYQISNSLYREDIKDTFGSKIGGFFFEIPISVRMEGYYAIKFVDENFQKLFNQHFFWISYSRQIETIAQLNSKLFGAEIEVPVEKLWLRDKFFPSVLNDFRKASVLNMGVEQDAIDVSLKNMFTVMRKIALYDQRHNGDYSRVYHKSFARFRKRGINVMLQKLREEAQARFRTKNEPKNLSIYFSQPLAQQKDKTIDIVIPSYRGIEETKECVESVVNSYNEVAIEIIVINDCGPEEELTQYLRKIANAGKITLIENKTNLGFVKSVNVGMRLHPERDVILLNSDTVVSSRWVDKLYRAAYQESNIATVTPFSNRATICSFPKSNVDNDLISGMSIDQLSNIFEQANDRVVVDIPTAVGFCMYIKRESINEVGYFDEEKWAKGYCEENDFSLKVATKGWRNVIACDTFVEHKGSVSFAGEKAARVEENLQKLLREYPEYNMQVQRFIWQDPIAPYRKSAAIELLKAFDGQYIVMISHNLGGGTKVAVDAIADCTSNFHTKILILEGGSESWTLSLKDSDLELVYFKKDIIELAKDLQHLSIRFIHFHQVIYFSWDIWELPSILGVPYYIAVHDYLYICPRLNLIDQNGQYCGEPDTQMCDQCVAKNGTYTGLYDKFDAVGHSVAKWRDRLAGHFDNAAMVIAPSADTQVRMKKYYPNANIVFKPHPERFHFELRSSSSETVNVIILGAISQIKGFQLLKECAEYAYIEKLNIHFHVIGFTMDDTVLLKYPNITISGHYHQDDLDTIISATEGNVALFLSGWPETYSYTLSEAWANGLYPIALDIGAFDKRMAEMEVGETISYPATPKTILAALISTHIRLNENAKQVKSFDYDTTMDSFLSHYYGV
ncbi:MAG: glycosyltransferase [Phycisphaerae bacterium]|nr:glycosyltransferase [Phycisphaerae bacterium]